MGASIRFLERCSFREERRYWESHLELDAFDSARTAGIEARLLAKGIKIRDLVELRREPGWDRKLYDLYVHVQRDVPSPVEITPPSFEESERLI